MLYWGKPRGWTVACMGHGDVCLGWAPPTLGTERPESVWQDGTHPGPIAASELKLHQLNFG